MPRKTRKDKGVKKKQRLTASDGYEIPMGLTDFGSWIAHTCISTRMSGLLPYQIRYIEADIRKAYIRGRLDQRTLLDATDMEP